MNQALQALGIEPEQEPEKKKRGRKPKYASNAERQAAYRARKGTETVTLEVPIELMEQLREWNRFKHLTYHEIFVEKLLRGQLLRKR